MLALICKARGVKLGNPNGFAALWRAGEGAVALRAAVVRNVGQHAGDLAAVVVHIRAAGAVSLRAIAGGLNARGMPTSRGGQWQVSNVRNLLERSILERRRKGRKADLRPMLRP